MKNVVKFLLFIIYATIIFFLPNNEKMLWLIVIHIIWMILAKTNIKKAITNLLGFLPFILFTVILNCVLDYYMNAIWLGIKLLLVCNITFIYARTTTIGRNC